MTNPHNAALNIGHSQARQRASLTSPFSLIWPAQQQKGSNAGSEQGDSAVTAVADCLLGRLVMRHSGNEADVCTNTHVQPLSQ